MEKIRVVVIEDQKDIAANVERILSQSNNIELAVCYWTAEDALKNLRQDSAEVYLVDLGLPGMNGVEFITQAVHVLPRSNFIVHTISENGRDLLDALSAGAVGYIIKGSPDKELLDGIASVASGGGLISPRMARRLFHFFKEIGSNKKPLTKTEMEVLNMLKTGISYDEIAENKNVSLSTVQSHIKSIYKKLNVNNRRDAVLTGTMFGLLDS